MAKATATPADVRAHFNMPSSKRGRIHADVLERFTAETGRKVVSVKPHSSISVKVKGQDKNGRNTTKTVKMATSEARTRLGDPAGKRGRFSADALATLGAQLAAEAK